MLRVSHPVQDRLTPSKGSGALPSCYAHLDLRFTVECAHSPRSECTQPRVSDTVSMKRPGFGRGCRVPRFPWSRVAGFSCDYECCLGFELYRAEHAEPAVPTLAVAPDLEIVEQ